MKEERVECPFCAELIMPGAAKCRFCREWLSTPKPSVNRSRSIEEIDRAEPHRGAIQDVRADYLTTMQGIEGRSRAIEKIEHRAGGLPDKNDGYADSTVETPDRVESILQPYWATIEDLPQHAEPFENTQHHDSGFSDGDNSGDSKGGEGEEAVEASPARAAEEVSSITTLESGTFPKETRIEKTRRGDDSIPDGDDSLIGEQHKGKKAVEVSPAPVWAELGSAKKPKSSHVPGENPMEKTQHEDVGLPDGDDAAACEPHKGEEVVEVSSVQKEAELSSAETLESVPVRKGTRIPWLRALMLLSYLGIIAALAVSESATHVILRDARAKESAQEYDAAFDMYRGILDSVPFSFATIEARNSLRRLCQSEAFEMPEPSWRPAIENLLGTDAGMPDVHLLPFVVWPVSAILLLLVFVTRIFRPGVALLALLLMVAAVAGSVGQFAWYGSISLPPVAGVIQEFMQATPVVYIASYLLFVLTALMTLTATAKRPSPSMAKPEELWDVCGQGVN